MEQILGRDESNVGAGFGTAASIGCAIAVTGAAIGTAFAATGLGAVAAGLSALGGALVCGSGQAAGVSSGGDVDSGHYYAMGA